jgi:DNA invertase Pin-like site-specific DNA recombinase
MTKCAIYGRVSTSDQHVETQLYPLRELAARRGFEVVHEYTDVGVSGSKARMPCSPMPIAANSPSY